MNRISFDHCSFVFFAFLSGIAQEGLEAFSPDDYLNLKLPPLEILLKIQKCSSRLYQVKMEEEASALKQRREAG